MIHINICITGRVQGVNFRTYTKEKAEAIGILGFVRNETDGSVYVEAEGSYEKINELVEWCKHGPPRAQVTNANVISGELKDFIR